MPSRQREEAWCSGALSDEPFDYKGREEEVLKLIQMSIEALQYKDSGAQPPLGQNMAMWLANEATLHAACLPGAIQMKAFIQKAYCHYAEGQWPKAAMMLEKAKTRGMDAWTSSNEEFLNECLELEDAAREDPAAAASSSSTQ